jgi:HK97 family phage portal protein
MSGPLTLKSPELARLMGYGPTSTGITVNEEKALTVSAVWSAVTMISDDIAALPLHLYKRLPGTRGGKDRFDTHPIYRLVHDSPNPEMDSIVFRRTLQAHVLIWQNGYAEIERDGAGRPVALWPLVPESVSPYRTRTGELRYRIRNPSGNEVDLAADDMIHLVGYSRDGSVGCSIVDKARESLGLTLATQQFGGTFFGNGATFGGVLSVKDAKGDLAVKNLREAVEARHQGVERAHKLLVLNHEATFTRIGVEPNAAQFLETRVFQTREVARWFKIPPHKLADLADATFSNVEQQNLDYYSSCLRPWITLWEQQLTRKLVARLEQRQQFIEHDTHGFLAADAAGRAALYTAESSVGSLAPNEIRGYENRNPLEGGDEPLVQIQNIPLGMVKEYWVTNLDYTRAQTEKLRQPPPEPPQPPPAADPMRDAYIGELRERLDVAERQTTEAKAETARAMECATGLESSAAAIRSELHTTRGLLATEQRLREDDQQRHDAAILVMTAERDDAIGREAAAVVRANESDATAAAATTQAQEATARASAADASLGSVTMDLQIERTANQNLLTELKNTREAHADRLAGVAIAHRALVVDVLRRMLDREVDRAKRHQTTPAKFRAWLDSFYQTHIDVIADAVMPAIRAHLALVGSDDEPRTLARQIAEDHAAESERQLRNLLQVDDFAPMLERTLAQWETSRPEAVADRLLKIGVGHVRTV